MSLSRHEQRLLRDVANRLARTDPDLADLLANFGRRAGDKRRAKPGRAAILAGGARRCGVWLLRAIAAGAMPVPGGLDCASNSEPEPVPPDQPGCDHA